MIELTFKQPVLLWLLLSLILLVTTHFYFLKHSKKKALKFANFETIKRVTGKSIITKNWTVLTLRFLILFLIILASSGPVLWYDGKSNKNDFVIAIDVSASMTAEDIPPSRLEVAKKYASQFIEKIEPNSEIGIITFAGTTFINKVPTKNKAEIKRSIDEIEIARTGGTDIPGTIITGTNLLINSMNGKKIIMITDGSSTVGIYLENSIKQSIAYAQDNHVIIDAIGIGSESEKPIGYIPEYYNITAVYNEENLMTITNQTGGKYYQAINEQEVINAFKQAAEDQWNAIINIDLTFALITIALILLFIEWGLINTRFRSVP